MRSKPVALVASALIVVSLVALLRGSCARRPTRSYEDQGALLMELGALTTYVCEACGAQSVGSFRPTPFPCAKCGKRAVVESARTHCLACGKTFEAFRRRSVMSADGKRPVAFEVKLPGEAWRRMKKPPVKCPACGNADPAKLRRVAPKVARPSRKDALPPPEGPQR